MTGSTPKRGEPDAAGRGGVPNEILKTIIGAYGADVVGPQAITAAHLGLDSTNAHMQAINDVSLRTALVEVGGRPAGTGVLVGADLVLTAAHVIDPTTWPPAADRPMVAVFDFDETRGRSYAESGIRVEVAGLVCGSPPSPDELRGVRGRSDPSHEYLDYAILRLRAAAPPRLDIGGPTPRGAYALDPNRYGFEHASLLLVVQHPIGDFLKQSWIKAAPQLNGTHTRITYRCNTTAGSSGGPIIDTAGRLVAMHHYGGGHGPNQGVPVHAIALDLRAGPHAHLFFGAEGQAVPMPEDTVPVGPAPADRRTTPVTLKFGGRLNVDSWAVVLRDLPMRSQPGWQAQLSGREVHIDLSAVGYADFVLLGQLLVLIHSITSAGARVTIILPAMSLLPGESAGDSEAARRQRQRRGCRLYIEQAGFLDALQPWPPDVLKILEGDTARQRDRLGAVAGAGAGELEKPQLPHRQRRMLPYRWMPPPPPGSTVRQAGRDSLQAALSKLGLPAEHSAALAKGLLSELLEGVENKSTGPLPLLIGATVIEPAVYIRRIDDVEPTLHRFVKWAAGQSSPLIRLVVADAGRQLAQTLSADLSTTEPEPPANPGTARLSKVERIVRSFEGSLTVWSGASLGGRDYSVDPDGVPVGGSVPAWIPGAFLGCDVLARPREDALRIGDEAFSPARPQPHTRTHLRCLTVGLRAGAAIAAGDLDRIAAGLSELSRRDAVGLVVAVDTPTRADGPSDDEIRDSIRSILTVAGQSPVPGTMALVFPSVNRRLLALAVEDLNDEFDTATAPPPHPALVVAPGNRHYWVGGTAYVRLILRTLSSAQLPLRMDELPSPDGRLESKARSVQRIRERSLLLEARFDAVSLRLRPHDAVDAVAVHLGARIRRAIDKGGGPGVERGTFLTPSLRETTRWCSVDEILTHMDSTRLTGFVLATRAASQLSALSEPGPEPSVVRVGHTSDELAESFARSLLGTEIYVDSIDALPSETGEPLPRRVVLVTDLLSTGNTLARTLGMAAARGVTVLGVAAVVDVRPLDAQGDHVLFHGTRVPLTSLTQVDIEPDVHTHAAGKLQPIDPVLRRPEPAVRAVPRPPLITQRSYIQILARVDGARLGHIHRPAGRHYTAYVDPTMLFRDADWTRRVLKLAVRRIRAAHERAFANKADDRRTVVLFPAGTGDDLGMVARLIAVAMVGTGLPDPVIETVPRAVLEASWLFPPSITFHEPPGHIVIIDSAVGTGRTVQQMIRIAAASGAAAVSVLVLLNGLTDLDTIALQQIANVRHVREGAATAEPVPVDVQFVARTAAGSIGVHECAICVMRRVYESLSPNVSLPPRLEERRTWLVHSMRPTSKRHAFNETATDLLGLHISQEDCVQYLHWRFDLREAAASTLRRHDVVRKIIKAAEDATVRDALVRLLVAEAGWLESAPLRFPEVRSRVADLAESLLIGDATFTVEPVLRIQATILLANTDPVRFAERMPQVIAANLDQDQVSTHVLLEALRILTRPESQSLVSRDLLVQTLVLSLLRLDSMVWFASPNLAGQRGMLPSREELRHLIGEGRRLLPPRAADAQGAWEALRTFGMAVRDHSYDGATWRLEVVLRNLARGESPRDPDGVRDDWQMCRDTLLVDVFPNLVPLRAALSAERVVTGLNRSNSARWDRIINGDPAQELQNLTARLESVLTNPAESFGTVDDVAGDLRWWNAFFLAARAESRSSSKSAFLVDTIERCPTRVLDVVRQVFDDVDPEIDVSGFQNPTDVMVFCPDTLVKDALTHIRINAESRHRAGGEGRQRFRVVLRAPDAAHVAVDVLNTRSARSTEGDGRGLGNLDREVTPFGGTVSIMDDVRLPWTFGVTVRFEKWRL